MKFKILTIATHNEGFFERLINNKYHQHIEVLGYGQKWTGFKMKNKLIYDYIKNLNDDEIIIILDGFDSIINKNPNEAIKIFKKNNYKVLFSKDPKFYNYLNSSDIIFSNCKNNIMINAGLYMGYVKYFKILLKETLKIECKDDQRIFNKLCKKYDFINIDENEEIFKNISLNNIKSKNKELIEKEINNKHNSIFIQFPGNITLKRIFLFLNIHNFLLLIL